MLCYVELLIYCEIPLVFLAGCDRVHQSTLGESEQNWAELEADYRLFRFVCVDLHQADGNRSTRERSLESTIKLIIFIISSYRCVMLWVLQSLIFWGFWCRVMGNVPGPFSINCCTFLNQKKYISFSYLSQRKLLNFGSLSIFSTSLLPINGCWF